MKHEEMINQLRILLEQAQIAVPDALLSPLCDHVEWLMRANSVVNLTAIHDPREALRLHTLDSLLALPLLHEAPPGRMCDIGTGGGFPGLPLSIASGRDAVLLDSVAKKAKILEDFVQNAGHANVEVIARRSEELALDPGFQFTVVVARAVAELPVLLELAKPLLMTGGVIVALKGDLGQEELARGDQAASILGLERDGTTCTRLPFGNEIRSIVRYVSTGSPAIALPRRPGMAKKRPIA